MGYYKLTNQRKRELRYCWWKGLPLCNIYERDLFLSEPNSLMVFERGMNMRFSEMIGNTGEPIRERLMRSTDAHTFWVQELSRERKAMKEKTYEGGRVWSKREKDLRQIWKKRCYKLVVGE